MWCGYEHGRLLRYAKGKAVIPADQKSNRYTQILCSPDKTFNRCLKPKATATINISGPGRETTMSRRKPPATVYLQWYEYEDPLEITWCQHRINESDVEYTLPDTAARAELERLREERAQQVEQFNAGYEAGDKGIDLITAEIDYFQAHPDEPNHDEFASGYALGSHVPGASAELERVRVELDLANHLLGNCHDELDKSEEQHAALVGLVRDYLNLQAESSLSMGLDYNIAAALVKAEAALRAAVSETEAK